MNYDNNIENKDLKKSILSKDIRGGYDLPDGYFADLKANVMAQVGQKEDSSWATTLKSLLGFVGGFAVLVLFAVGIVNLTPDQKTDAENGEYAEVETFMIYSNLSEEEVVELIYEKKVENAVGDETVEQNPESIDDQQFNEVVDEYVNTFGGVENE